jgi:hypothetical protein
MAVSRGYPQLVSTFITYYETRHVDCHSDNNKKRIMFLRMHPFLSENLSDFLGLAGNLSLAS